MRVTPEEAHAWLEDYFRRRDLGLGKGIIDVILNPPNPFEPQARRLPRPGFLFGAGLFTFVVGWFFYFNFAR